VSDVDAILSAGRIAIVDTPTRPTHVIDTKRFDQETNTAPCLRCHADVPRIHWLLDRPCRTTHVYGQLVRTDVGVYVSCERCAKLLTAAEWMEPCPAITDPDFKPGVGRQCEVPSATSREREPSAGLSATAAPSHSLRSA
jgi:hypothetical protein